MGNVFCNKLISLLISIIFILTLSSCASTIDREVYKDAKLMPEEVARNVIDRELGSLQIEGFYLFAQTKFIAPLSFAFCDYKDPRFFKLKEVEIEQWSKINNTIWITTIEKFDEIGFPCSDPLTNQYKKYMTIIPVQNKESLKETIDALVSLGVSIDLSK